MGGQKEEIRMIDEEIVKLKYSEFVADNYKYSGGLYNQNTPKYDGVTKPQIGLESEWVTT